MSISVERLCHELPNEFRDYLDYCKGLQFEEEPDYDFLRGLFKQLALKLEIEYDGVFDWNLKETKTKLQDNAQPNVSS